MFTSTVPADFIPAPAGSSALSGLSLSVPTVVAGSLIGSALVGRVVAWLSGGTTIAQLAMLLVIALVALLAGFVANSSAATGTLDARLAKLTLRAGGVQTALGLVTMAAAVL